ncbi:5,6-dimethylbenzimidazole synthase [Chitinophaga flava]|uniref:5,6-dimethylbenzimidazole synthase n=1 Tax=Chitinophaga flava TaxID=2259036 RepID=A0A365XZC3_9BACT|nr:5,6-dimethylbenzimidazole synthase [Chitinophaga flava]RBL91024.1 5,6-dimethylbenzimidazole synthase [Chitinophaga flava]
MDILNGKLFTAAEATVLEDVIVNRRDVRGNRFLDKPIEPETLNKILDAALHAPSVGFSQPWEFVLIEDNQVKQQIKDSFAAENEKAISLFDTDKQPEYIRLKLEGILEAPVNIAVFYKPAGKPVLGQTSMEEVGLYSVVCAVQNIWLMARALNIGVGWVSILDPEQVKNILKAPAENKLVAYLCLGHTDGFYTSPELELLQWEKRKMKDTAVFYNTY